MYNNHCFSGNQEEVTQREKLGVGVDWGGETAAGKLIIIYEIIFLDFRILYFQKKLYEII